MSRRAAAFTEADVKRALKAAQAAQPGVVYAVEIAPGGVVRIIPAPEPSQRRTDRRQEDFVEPPGGLRF